MCQRIQIALAWGALAHSRVRWRTHIALANFECVRIDECARIECAKMLRVR